ncbi:hypothetical protein [Halobacillus sp. BBL2006]|uniref:hypothetical protein n=1 Tax=Halobacillus sp. BBL2006 TaxID=1543706 RepID=UPI000AD17BBB|nr:hypothetical protein [Halobacillus sp. BBL2006]
MPELEAGHTVKRKPLAHEHAFAEMFDKDRFDDGIPLDELGKHLRKTKSYKKLRKRWR